MSAQYDRTLPLDWDVLIPAGPTLAHHAGCVIDNTFYIHGGVTEHRSILPLNKLYSCDLNTLIWNEVRVEGSPALSHHACISVDNRYMVLIGGWDGQKRLSRLSVFDTVNRSWMVLNDTGFAEGAGLSSHAVALLDNGDVLVHGREGCLRTVEKHGHAYILHIDIGQLQCSYTKITDDTVSRSGHTLNGVGNCVYVIGGRDDDFVECMNGVFSSQESTGAFNSRFLGAFREGDLLPLKRVPNGRRNHVAVSGRGCIVIHGGETFDGRSRTPVGDMFLLLTKPTMKFYKIGTSAVARASHVCVSIGDRVIFHGGIGWKNVIYGDCYELKING